MTLSRRTWCRSWQQVRQQHTRSRRRKPLPRTPVEPGGAIPCRSRPRSIVPTAFKACARLSHLGDCRDDEIIGPKACVTLEKTCSTVTSKLTTASCSSAGSLATKDSRPAVTSLGLISASSSASPASAATSAAVQACRVCSVGCFVCTGDEIECTGEGCSGGPRTGADWMLEDAIDFGDSSNSCGFAAWQDDVLAEEGTSTSSSAGGVFFVSGSSASALKGSTAVVEV
mmetsp:Transcript_5584/g.9289  ORF Transcript_5584/g.9289 Transcript_5584/m.9289 type:complete len:228 (+) Transcript_5584:1158-1841(+)